jgi:hypothetical protein
MRKTIMLAGLVLGAALATGAPAKAELGCECVKLGAAPGCTATVLDCNFKVGGLCIAPCDYQPPKKMTKRHHKKKKI